MFGARDAIWAMIRTMRHHSWGNFTTISIHTQIDRLEHEQGTLRIHQESLSNLGQVTTTTQHCLDFTYESKHPETQLTCVWLALVTSANLE
jgi:hypothetical protein